MNQSLLIVHAMATWYMVGLIWMVQVVHYPMFDRVGEAQFPRYEADHSRLITPVVGLPMLVELGTAVALAFLVFGTAATDSAATNSAALRTSGQAVLVVGGLIMLIMIWGTTALISVPCHTKLAAGFDAETHRWLVTSNWIRTTLWSLRGLLAGWLLYR